MFSLRSDTIATGLGFLNRLDPRTHFLTNFSSYLGVVCGKNIAISMLHSSDQSLIDDIQAYCTNCLIKKSWCFGFEICRNEFYWHESTIIILSFHQKLQILIQVLQNCWKSILSVLSKARSPNFGHVVLLL